MFVAMYALALLEDDVNTLRALDCIGDHLNKKKVSFCYGALARTPLHAEQAKEKIMFMPDYIQGLISKDNLALLLLLEVVWWKPATWLTAAQHCAKKTMGHIGYGPCTLPMYISGAMVANNKETIKYLSTKIGVNLHQEIGRFVLYIDFDCAQFVCWLIQESYYQPTEADWNILKSKKPDLYRTLQSDV